MTKSKRQFDAEIAAIAAADKAKTTRPTPRKKKSDSGALHLGLVPGTPGEQKSRARQMLAQRRKPLAIVHAGPGDWRVVVLGVDIGSVSTKANAKSAVHTVGRYRLDLGDFVYAYTDGYTD